MPESNTHKGVSLRAQEAAVSRLFRTLQASEVAFQTSCTVEWCARLRSHTPFSVAPRNFFFKRAHTLRAHGGMVAISAGKGERGRALRMSPVGLLKDPLIQIWLSLQRKERAALRLGFTELLRCLESKVRLPSTLYSLQWGKPVRQPTHRGKSYLCRRTTANFTNHVGYHIYSSIS